MQVLLTINLAQMAPAFKVSSGFDKQQTNPMATIPTLVSKKQDNASALLAAGIKDEAKLRWLQKKSDGLMTNDELQKLWDQLERLAPSSGLLNYDDFQKVSSSFEGFKAKEFFTVKIFAKLSFGSTVVNIANLFNFIARKTWFSRTKIKLMEHDITEDGYLTEMELENYIRDLVPTISQLSTIEPAFQPFYTCVAVRKFMFFLDPHRSGKVKINDILESGFLDDIVELRSEELRIDREDTNWFSVSNYQRLYDHYVTMDVDQNGMLSLQEMKAFGDVPRTFTDAFLERFFEETICYEGEIDYKSFIDFMIALENKKEVQSLHFFFKLFDVTGKGYLNSFDLFYFYKSIKNHLTQSLSNVVDFNYVRDEILDIIKPVDSEHITFQELVSCQQGHNVVSLLIEFTGYLDYETGDSTSAPTPEEGGEVKV